MRALVMTAPAPDSSHTELRDLDEPRPGPGEVAIEVSHAGINFLDVMTRRGDGGYGADWPFVPGREVAGTVRAVGPDVAGLHPGQRVAAFTPGGGGLAEIALARAALVVPVPDGVPFRTAAAAPLMASTALLLLTDAARLGPGDTVLVHSAGGGVGGALAQLLPELGAGRRIGVVGRPEKIDAVRDSGYDVALARGDGLADAVRAATGGRGVDIVLDPLGTSLLEVDLAVTAPGGRIVLFGNAEGGPGAPLPAAGELRSRNVAIVGFSISSLAGTAPDRVAGALRHVFDLIGRRRLDLPVHELASLADASTAIQSLADGRGSGKYVVRVGG